MPIQFTTAGRAKRYAIWTDLVFGRLLGAKRFREHTIDLLGHRLPVPRVDVRGRILSVDYSLGMLDVARARNEQEGWQNVASRPGRRGEACFICNCGFEGELVQGRVQRDGYR